MNLTPKRLRALRMIQQRPGMHPRELVEITDRQDAPWHKGGTWSGFDRPTAAAAATRWGAGYAKPMIEAGLIRRVYQTVNGWPTTRLFLTDKGQEVARSGEYKP